jgi:hypothetical protein
MGSVEGAMPTHRESDRFSAHGTDGNTYVVIRYANSSSGGPASATASPSSYQTSDGQQVRRLQDRFIIRDSGVVLWPDEPPFHNVT